jgi:hypothetical protein
MRWRERRPGDPGVEADVADLGEWGPELLALRAEPRPEFLACLDRRMQPEFARGRAHEQLAAQRPRRRLGLLPALGIAVPAAAGGAAAPESESALLRPGGRSAPAIGIVSRQVAAGEPVVLRYSAPRAGSVFVSLSPTAGGSAASTRAGWTCRRGPGACASRPTSSRAAAMRSW